MNDELYELILHDGEFVSGTAILDTMLEHPEYWSTEVVYHITDEMLQRVLGGHRNVHVYTGTYEECEHLVELFNERYSCLYTIKKI